MCPCSCSVCTESMRVHEARSSDHYRPPICELGHFVFIRNAWAHNCHTCGHENARYTSAVNASIRQLHRGRSIDRSRACSWRSTSLRWTRAEVMSNCWKTEKEIHHVVGHSGKSGPRIRWHYTTTILRLRIGARLTAHFYPCTLALSAGTPGWLSPKLRLQLKIDVAAGENPHDAWTAYSSCTAAETVEWVQVKGKERSERVTNEDSGTWPADEAEMTVGHTFWPVTHVTHQPIDPRLTTTHESWLPTIAVSSQDH